MSWTFKIEDFNEFFRQQNFFGEFLKISNFLDSKRILSDVFNKQIGYEKGVHKLSAKIVNRGTNGTSQWSVFGTEKSGF